MSFPSSPTSVPADSPLSTYSITSSSNLSLGDDFLHHEQSSPGGLAQTYDQLDSADLTTAGIPRALSQNQAIHTDTGPESPAQTHDQPEIADLTTAGPPRATLDDQTVHTDAGPESLAQTHDQLNTADLTTASAPRVTLEDQTIHTETAPEPKYIYLTLPIIETRLRCASEEYPHVRQGRALSTSSVDSMGSETGHEDSLLKLGLAWKSEFDQASTNSSPRIDHDGIINGQASIYGLPKDASGDDSVYSHPTQDPLMSPCRTPSPESLGDHEDDEEEDEAEERYRSPQGGRESFWNCRAQGEGLNRLGRTKRLGCSCRLSNPDLRSTTAREWMRPHRTTKSWMACENHLACRRAFRDEAGQSVPNGLARNSSSGEHPSSLNKLEDGLIGLGPLQDYMEADMLALIDRRRKSRLGDPRTGRRGIDADGLYSNGTTTKMSEEELQQIYGSWAALYFPGQDDARRNTGGLVPTRLQGFSDVNYGFGHRLADGSLFSRPRADRFDGLWRLDRLRGFGTDGVGWPGLSGFGGLGGYQTGPNLIAMDQLRRKYDNESMLNMRGGGSPGPSKCNSPAEGLLSRISSLESLPDYIPCEAGVTSVLDSENPTEIEPSLGNVELQDADSNRETIEVPSITSQCYGLPQSPTCNAITNPLEDGSTGSNNVEQSSCAKQITEEGETQQISHDHNESSGDEGSCAENFRPPRPLRLLLVDASATEYYKEDLSHVQFSVPDNTRLKEILEEASKQATVRSQLVNQASSSTSAPTQAQLLGRHEECICDVARVEAGLPPARPAHEELAPWEYVTIRASRDGRYILTDSNCLTWYLFERYVPESDSDSSSILGLRLIDCGQYSPQAFSELELLSTNISQALACPCYEEVHGEGAIEAFIARYLGPMRSSQPREREIVNLVERKAYIQRKTHSILMNKYQATFPYLDSWLVSAKVLQDVNYLVEQSDYVLEGAITSEEIIEFYSASDFENETSDDFDQTTFATLDEALSERLEYPELDVDGKAICPRAIQALKNRYLAKYPWLGEGSARRKAQFDVFWLREQHPMHVADFFDNIKFENVIISFYDAAKWDTWKPEDEVNDSYYVEARELTNQGKPSKWDDVLNAIVNKDVTILYLKRYWALKTEDWNEVDTDFDIDAYWKAAEEKLVMMRNEFEKENRVMTVENVVEELVLEEFIGLNFEGITEEELTAQIIAEAEHLFDASNEKEGPLLNLEGNAPFGGELFNAWNGFSGLGGLSGLSGLGGSYQPPFDTSSGLRGRHRQRRSSR